MQRSLLLAALVLAAPAIADAATADGNPGGAEGIVVTSSRTGEGLDSSTLRITAADLDRLQPVSLLDVLDQAPGVRAISTGGAGGGSYVSIRGGDPNFTLVLIDGVRVNDSTNSKGGAFDFSMIDPSLVQSIDINHAAVSAVHGSDALSGVVNIHLKEPEAGKPEGVLRYLVGSQAEIGADLSLAQGWQDGGILVGGGVYQSNDLTKGSTLGRAQGLVRVNQQLGDYESTAFVIYARNRRHVFPEDSGGPDFAVLRDKEQGDGSMVLAALALRHRAEGVVQPHISLSYGLQRNRVDTPAIAPGILQGTPAISANDRLRRVELIGDVVADLGQLKATMGGALLDEDGKSNGAIDFGFPVPADFHMQRRTYSGFTEATFTPTGAVALNGALRYDHTEARGGEWTGRLGLSLVPFPAGPVFFGRVSEGFKLPSFYALASPLVGNADLKPERSRNWEAGLHWALDRGAVVEIAWFDNRFTDLIDFDSASFRMVNRDHVRAHGIESSIAWRPVAAIGLAADLSWQKLSSPSPLRNHPEWQGGVRGDWQATRRLGFDAAVRFNSNFFDSSIPTGLLRQQGHARLDLGAQYQLTPGLDLRLAAKNVTDTDYEDAVGFPATGPLVEARIIARLF